MRKFHHWGRDSIALASALSLALPVNADRPLHQKQVQCPNAR
ncbi:MULTISPECIES: hypothetical protein [unclassified Microcoleus]|nr:MULTISPECIES: hypothetical protein [unclassified Microcoleus]